MELAESLRGRSDQTDDPVLRELMEAGRLLTRREGLVRSERQLGPRDERRLQAILPRDILEDTEADWPQWPGIPLRF